MVVYSISFVITSIFIYFAAFYYKKFYYNQILVNKLNKNSTLTIKTIVDENIIKDFIHNLSYGNHKKWKYLSWVFIFLSIVPLVVISSMRDYTVGTDVLYTYVPNYYSMSMYNYTDYSEPLFYLLLLICTKISINPTTLLFASSLIYIYVLIKSIVKHSDNVIISVIICFFGCFYFIFLNNMRQSLASIFMLYAFDSFSEKKLFKFTLFFLIALGFHYSSIVLLVPFIFLKFKLFKKHYFLLTTLLFLLLPVFCTLFIRLISLAKYSYFINTDFNNNSSNTANILFNTAIYIVSFIVLRKKKNNKNAFALLTMQFFATYVALSSLFIRIGELTSRITLYFAIFQILLIPKLYHSLKPGIIRNLFIILMISAYFAYMFIYIIVRGYHNVLPYLFI